MTRRVLAVEDNEQNRRLLVQMLQLLDCAVDVATDGAEAVAVMQRRSYDLVFMDWRMPEMDGLEAVRIIRQQENESGRERTPVIAMTGNVHESDRQACLDGGMDGFIGKPFRLDDLRTALDRFARTNPIALDADGPRG